MNRILIIEDELRIAAFLEKGLKASGFTTTTVGDGKLAVEMVFGDRFDLIILDLGLPGKDGLTILEELRGQGVQTPVIILTARDDIQDKVVGFEAGADDYVTKPFRFEELLARIRARLRNSGSNENQFEKELRFNNVTLNLQTRRVHVGDRIVELSAREFTLAETLLRHPNQVMSREQLLDHVWGCDYNISSNIVDVYIGYLRKKLGENFVKTIRGMGYSCRV
jgi:two-component system, OmpR family, response regulator QseB